MLDWLSNAFTGYDHFQRSGDIRTKEMFLMQSPITVIFICISYLYFVKNCGPKWMANKKAFNLKSIIAIYNVFQVISNSIFFYHGTEMWIRYYGWGMSCLPVNVVEEREGDNLWAAKLVHIYFLNKLSDLVDTVFFVLSKKNSKISALHVIHHVSMPIAAFLTTKFTPGGNPVFVGLPNSFVHIWMYLYYLLANLGPQYQKYIWWKQNLTEMQLIQFGVIGLYIGYTSYICALHVFITAMIFALNAIFIYLFIDFYIKAYKTSSTRVDKIRGLGGNNKKDVVYNNLNKIKKHTKRAAS